MKVTRITFDSKADAMYIYFKEVLSAKTESIDDGVTTLDFDTSGSPIGIEFLNVSKRFPRSLFKEIVKSKKLGKNDVEVSE